MKVTISPSGFSTLHGRSNCKEISSRGAGSPCKRCGRHAVSLRSPSCQRLAVSASHPVSLLQFHPVPPPGLNTNKIAQEINKTNIVSFRNS